MVLLAVTNTAGCVLSPSSADENRQTHYVIGFGRITVETRDPITATDVNAIGIISNTTPHPSFAIGFLRRTSVMFDQNVAGDVTISAGGSKVRTANFPNQDSCQKEE